MKRHKAVWGLGLILSLFISAATVFASAAPAAGTNSNRAEKTPGAKATEKAAQRATDGRGKQRANYHGTVASAAGGVLSLTTTDGQSLTFVVTAATKINVPGKGVHGALSDLTAGARALVQAARGEGDQLTAVHIVLQSGQGHDDEDEDEDDDQGEAVQAPRHWVGTVTAYAVGESITLQGSDGSTTTFEIAGDTRILPASRAGRLAVGARVTVIVPAESDGDDDVAAGIVVHPTKPVAAPTPAA